MGRSKGISGGRAFILCRTPLLKRLTLSCLTLSFSISNLIIEDFELVFSPKVKLTRNPILNEILKKETEYEYVEDPNFDFDNREVEEVKVNNRKSDRVSAKLRESMYESHRAVEEEEVIQKPYELNIQSKEEDINEEDFFEPSEDEISQFPTGDLNDLSDLKLTLPVEPREKYPGRMAQRPQLRLKEVCESNGYDFSMNDLDDTKVNIGKGAYGEGKPIVFKI